jgi:hypothetical protein
VLVCPQCRNDNVEEAAFCRVCGRALEPTGSVMRRVEREEHDEPAFDLPSRPTGPPWMALGLVVVAALAVAGWAVFSTAQPDPCRGRFSSSLYPYCAQIPQGWEGGAALDGTETIDRFVRDSREVEAVANVRVEQVVDTTVQTQQYAQQFRTSQEADGLDPSAAELVDLDGEQALAWNYTVEGNGPAEPPLLFREVIMVRPEGAWRVTLIATEDAYQEARIAFERLLNSWRWKS